MPAVEAVIQRVAARGNESVAAAGGHDSVWKIADAVAEVVPLLAAISGAVERGEFARQLALAVGAQPRDVEEAIAMQRRGGDPREAVRVQPRRSGAQDRIIEQLVRSLIEHPGLLERIAADELLALLPAGRPAEIVRALAAEPRAARLDLDALCERVSDDTKALLRELATSSAELDAETATRILDDTIRWLRKRLRGEQSRALTRRLRDADQDWRSVLEAKQQLRGRPEGPQRRPELAS
jgi:hypothetical protein